MHCRIDDALATGDLKLVREAIDYSHDNLWGVSAGNTKDMVGNVDGNLIWELVIAPECVANHNAQLQLFVPGSTQAMHSRSRFNDRDEHSTSAQYKMRMKARGHSQHGRSKMILGPWKDNSKPAPHQDSCEVYAACHCYEAIVDAFIEDPTNVQLQMTVSHGLKDVIMLKPGVPDIWKRKIVTMLNEHSTGSGCGIQQAVNLRIRHAKGFI